MRPIPCLPKPALKPLAAALLLGSSLLGSAVPPAQAQTSAPASASASKPASPASDSALDHFIHKLETGAKDVATGAAGLASDLVMNAMGLLGVRYRMGGNDADSGLDCSGLVRLVFQQTFGLVLPRRSAEISQLGEKVDRKELRPGDLVFFNTLRRAYSHVGIYVGDGKFLHAPSSGGEVRVESMNIPYWNKRFNGARRIEPTEQTASAAEGATPGTAATQAQDAARAAAILNGVMGINAANAAANAAAANQTAAPAGAAVGGPMIVPATDRR
ncbi:C40 family peptidase [Piscinibacterium candidicorallinum]|uniref:C40 family peptidase n=1 Tax=Piscinibacterium candidicorallinum TaxID=1793872 RepID=A0ABV7H3X6_9BURK